MAWDKAQFIRDLESSFRAAWCQSFGDTIQARKAAKALAEALDLNTFGTAADISFSAYLNTDHSIGGLDTYLPLNANWTGEHDPNVIFTPSNGSLNIPVNGLYHVHGQVTLLNAANSVGLRIGLFNKGGAGTLLRQWGPIYNGSGIANELTVTMSAFIRLFATNSYDLRVAHDTGTPRDVSAGSTLTYWGVRLVNTL